MQTLETNKTTQSVRINLGNCWAMFCFLLAGFLVWKYFEHRHTVAPTPQGIADGSQLSATQPRPIAIGDIQLGQRLLGRNPELTDAERDHSEPDPNTWRRLRLRMEKGNGTRLDIQLLRPLEWIAAEHAAPGATIELSLEELGASGPAEVLSIEPCPPIQPPPGNIVTGKFLHHSDGNLLNLWLEGQEEPTGVTSNHPYWSLDRQEFIPAGDLEIGERVATIDGESRVTGIEARPDEPVCNLEVHGEHVYLVGSLGTLVHNKCPAIIGNAQRTSAGHPETVEFFTQQLADTGSYDWIIRHSQWSTILKYGNIKLTKPVGRLGRLPDLVGARTDGKIDLIEVMSEIDERPGGVKTLLERYADVWLSIPAEKRGEYIVVERITGVVRGVFGQPVPD